uniref:hypothetical protein n=1 Tax=uncultured Flavonifractor sp. TaxID=1193534 RepID=UPI00262C113B|nr:hypothetical protein [uncultured Flavonifractor sp.]
MGLGRGGCEILFKKFVQAQGYFLIFRRVDLMAGTALGPVNDGLCGPFYFIKKLVEKSPVVGGACTCKMKVDTHKSVGVYFFHGKMKKRR